MKDKYKMKLLYVAFLVGIVNASNLVKQARFKAINFAEAIIGRKLNGSVINESEVDSEISCQIECLRESRCVSYNFGTTQDKKRFKCQLSDSDRFRRFKNFTEDGEWFYRGIQSVCESDPFLCGNKGVCIPDYQRGSYSCSCDAGYAGKPCKAKSCNQLLQDGFTSSGIYLINPDGGKPIRVFCDMTTDGGGWTVFQRRLDGSVDFYLGWKSYKNGFGDLKAEFWLGNDNLHRLTAADDVILRVELEDFDGNIKYAKYTTFKVADEADKYRLLLGGYSGTAGDHMSQGIQRATGMRFSTKDNDNDSYGGHCAVKYKGAWWYRGCHGSNLNGRYHGGRHSSFADGVNWYAYRGHYYSLKRTVMELKPATASLK